MGEVYEAEDLHLNRVRVALKTIRSDYATNPEMRERFKQEILLARSIRHPNVCPVYDLFVACIEKRQVCFCTMKLLTGETLAARLRREQNVCVPEALAIARQIASALQAAHDIGVVHRDLKPGNIFLENSAASLRAVVTDFGLAKSWRDVSELKSASVVGTPGYIAPEVLSGETWSPRSDVYAFGVVLREMIFGFKPTDGNKGDVSTIRVPERILRVIRQCCEMRPESRFASVSAAIQALDERSPQTSVTTRRKLFGSLALGTAAAATAVWLERDNLLAPVPKPRRVGLLPPTVKGLTPEDVSFLNGVLDSVGLMLGHAESSERDLFVVPPREARRQKAFAEAELVGMFGVNLLLSVSPRWISNAFQVNLNLLRAPGGSTIRQTTISCPSSTLFHLPAMVAAGASKILGLKDNIGAWQASAPKTDKPEAYAAYERARGLMAVGGLANADKALDELQKAVTLDSQFAEAWAALGQAYSLRYSLTRDASNLDLADRNVKKAFALAPGLPAAYSSRAAIELNRGQHDEAIRDLQTAVRLEPENSDILLNLAHAYAASGKLDLADQTYETLLQLRPNDWTPLNDWGSIYFRCSNYGRAEQLFHQATVAAPEAALPWRNLGAVYLETDQMDSAQKAFDRSIAILPSGEAYANRGTALFWLARYQEAARAYKAAVNLNTNRYEIWGSLGDAYQMLGKNSQARAAWQKAVMLAQASLVVNATHRDSLASLALYQAKLGEAESALASIRKLDSKGQLTPGQLYLEAVAYELMHKREMALRLLKDSIVKGYSKFEVNHAPELRALRQDLRFQKLAIG